MLQVSSAVIISLHRCSITQHTTLPTGALLSCSGAKHVFGSSGLLNVCGIITFRSMKQEDGAGVAVVWSTCVQEIRTQQSVYQLAGSKWGWSQWLHTELLRCLIFSHGRFNKEASLILGGALRRALLIVGSFFTPKQFRFLRRFEYISFNQVPAVELSLVAVTSCAFIHIKGVKLAVST